MKILVVIPTHDGRDRLLDALASLADQTVEADVVVVDNASGDGTAEAVAERFPHVHVVRNERNLGFGAAINRAALELEGDLLVLVNNDVVCEPAFLERIATPFADEGVGSVAGVLLQAAAPELVDSAGIELDTTLGSWDHGWNRPAAELDAAWEPVGPCGGAAAYRLPVFRELGGFDEALFAYWEDVDLALRFRAAGRRCVLAPNARALHAHGQTLGAASPAARRLEAFGRGYVLAKYRVAAGRPLLKLKVAALDWPVLLVHLLLRREAGPLRARLRGRARGLRGPAQRTPLELATVGFATALGRQLEGLRLRLAGGLPAHFTDSAHMAEEAWTSTSTARFGWRDIYIQARRGSVEWLNRHKRLLDELETWRNAEGADVLTVLDFGGGSAALHTVASALGLSERYVITVVDTDRDALDLAPPSVQTIHIDPEGVLPFESNAFDVTVSSDVFEHIPHDARDHWANECRRVGRLGQIHTMPTDGGMFSGQEADRNFDAWYVARQGHGERFTVEHLEYGLPRDDEIARLFPGARVQGFANVDVWQSLIRRQFQARSPIGRLKAGLWYRRFGVREDGRPPFKSALIVERSSSELRGRPRKN